jgi:transformation/transcription domain-associated protein
MPHRERVLAAMFTKPLRAVPYPMQIGMLEAVRYCVSLNPPLAEMNDELLRLLQETLAIADADDPSTFSRSNMRQNGIEMVKLRVACIKLLTASMPITDFFSKQEPMRQKLRAPFSGFLDLMICQGYRRLFQESIFSLPRSQRGRPRGPPEGVDSPK